MSIKGLFTVMAGVAAVAAPAAAGSSYTVGIEAHVPVICRLTMDGPAVTEFCNAPDGYQVWADAAPGATLTIDGQPVALSDTAPTLIVASQTAAFRTRQMTAEGQVSLRITPL